MVSNSLLQGIRDFFRSGEVRRIDRLRKESPDWPEILADAYDWTRLDPDGDAPNAVAVPVRGTLAFTLNDERHYGLVFGELPDESDAKDFLASAKPMQLTVRYNPADPDEMSAFPGRSELPFKVWIEWQE